MNKILNIAIFSVPRSGSTWLGQIFNSLPSVVYRFQPNFAYSFPYYINDTSDNFQIENFYNELLESTDPFVNGEISISGKNNIEFKKDEIKALVWKEVHALYLTKTILQNSTTKVIGIIRSPFSVIASWIKIPREFDPNWDVNEEWRFASLKNNGSPNNFFGYEKWKETVMLFLELREQFPKQFYLVNYEDLLKHTEREVSIIFDFCGLEMHGQTREFLLKTKESNEKDAYSIYKSKKDDCSWKESLPKFIVEEICLDPDFIELNEMFHWIRK